MKTYTNTEIKRTAKAAIESFTGCTTKLSDITLLEASCDRTYILFKVKNIEYRFTSYKETINFSNGKTIESVWCGDGTIERIGRR